MSFPFVSRAKYEALEDKLDAQLALHAAEKAALEQRYADLKANYDELDAQTDKVLDSILHPTVVAAEEPDTPQQPRRPLGRDIVGMATADAGRRFREFQAWDAAQPKRTPAAPRKRKP